MRSWIGLNLPGVRPTDRGACFNDATCSADWFKTPDNKTPLPLSQVNAAGYPAGDFAWQVFYKCPPAAYNGVYTLEADGIIQRIAGMSSPLQVEFIGNSPDGKTLARITVNATKPGETASMTLRFTGVRDVSRIRIWRGEPPADGQRRWHTLPLDLVRRANAGCVRGMEYLRINSGRPVVNPSDFTSVDAPTYCYAGPDAPTGCPPRLLYELCNAAGADAWDCVWIDSTDDAAAAQFALARDTLRPDAFYRFQLHNELWNEKFAFARANAVAKARGRELAAQGKPGFIGITDPRVLGWRYNAHRSVELVKLAREAFGAKQRHRVRATLCGQAYDNRPLDEARAYLREVGIDPADYFDSYAVTHYFGAARADVETTLAALPADADAALTHRDAQQFFDACRADGVRPFAYEAGTGFEGDAAFLSAVLRDPRTNGVNQHALSAWRERVEPFGGGLWMKFTAWGDWGRSSFAATDDPAWQSPTLAAFAEYGPTWPYAGVPDPDWAGQVAELEQRVAAVAAERDAARAERDAARETISRVREAVGAN